MWPKQGTITLLIDNELQAIKDQIQVLISPPINRNGKGYNKKQILC